MEINKLYNEDCMEGMKRIADQSVDMILCDLPYGVINRNRADARWDIQLPLDALWEEYRRIAKPEAAIVLFAQGMFTAHLMKSNPDMWRYNLIWKKGEHVTGFLDAKKKPLRCHEDILVFYAKAGIYHPQMTKENKLHWREGHRDYSSIYGKMNGSLSVYSNERYPVSIISFPRDYPVLHPTQKPLSLCEYLIRTYTDKGALVMDNCAGSGTTAVAAIRTGRNYLCFEKNKHYYDVASKRIADAELQVRLMLPFSEEDDTEHHVEQLQLFKK